MGRPWPLFFTKETENLGFVRSCLKLVLDLVRKREATSYLPRAEGLNVGVFEFPLLETRYTALERSPKLDQVLGGLQLCCSPALRSL
jgi:hypothetical protein